MPELKQFHDYYDHDCYLPPYVFCGQSMLTCLPRRSRIATGPSTRRPCYGCWVRRLCQAWPDVRIIMGADSGFCRQDLIRWCERADMQYIIGLARNKCLVSEFTYTADSWNRLGHVITLLEHGSRGINPRFIVTHIVGSDASALYNQRYCARGEAENRIKQAQLDLFGTRASCHKFAANQFRLLLAALAYTLMQRLREQALQGTELERASAATIRVRLLKIGAAIVRNTRRVRILLASHHPLRDVFAHAVRTMAS